MPIDEELEGYQAFLDTCQQLIQREIVPEAQRAEAEQARGEQLVRDALALVSPTAGRYADLRRRATKEHQPRRACCYRHTRQWRRRLQATRRLAPRRMWRVQKIGETVRRA